MNSKEKNRKARIGQIDFSNCLPVNLPIKRNRVTLEGEFVSRVPAELNSLIEADKLDVSAVSLFCYLNSDKLKLVDGLTVSSLGPVGSVLFFYKGNIRDLKDKPVLVPKASATSTNLLSIIINQETGGQARFASVVAPDLEEDEAVKGALVIGDEALKVDPRWSENFNRLDLGEWWYSRYQLPMVFGVWAARKSYIEENKESFLNIERCLNQARDIGLSEMLDDVVDVASKIMNLRKERVTRYFTEELTYALNEEHLKSISLYNDLLKELKLVKNSGSLIEEVGLVK